MIRDTRKRILVPLNKVTGEKCGVICIPHAGAGAGAFRSLGRALTVPGWGVRLPARENRLREAPLQTVESMATHILDAVRQLDIFEFVILGHCSGALVAYELALQMRDSAADGYRLSLVVSSSPAPCWAPDEPTDSKRGIDSMSNDELVRNLSAAGGTDSSLFMKKELWNVLLPAYRADASAVELYKRTPRTQVVDIPILVLNGSDDNTIPESAYAAWRQMTSSRFQMKTLPGSHFYIAGQEEAVAHLVSLAAK